MIKSISPKTKIKDLLAVNQDLVITALIKLNKNFAKLKNPLLRNLLARRVSIADACKIGGCTLHDFLDAMKQVGFKVEIEAIEEKRAVQQNGVFQEAGSYRTLDVRPLLAQDQDPLKEILAGISILEENQGLKLINTFEPLPLINLLADRGFSHLTVSPEPEVFITYFNRDATKSTVAKDLVDYNETVDADFFDEVLKRFHPDHIRYLDVRQLEMPKPMVSILEQLQNLESSAALFVYHKKTPVYLLPELEKLGFSFLFNEIAPGNVNMLIYKP